MTCQVCHSVQNPNSVNTGNGLEQGSAGTATFAKLEMFKGFLPAAVNCHGNAPKSHTRQKKEKEMRKYSVLDVAL